MKSSFIETTPKIVGGAIIGFVALAALYFFIYTPINAKNSNQINQNSETSTSSLVNDQNSTTPVASAPSSSTTSASPYMNGSYTASIDYMVPKSDNTITVQMTIDNGTVTAVKATHDYNDRESDFYIANFDSLIQQEVTGKKIDEVSIGRVGGASLTSNAFEDAIATIKNEAKS